MTATAPTGSDPPPEPIDAEALVQTAVRRIADAMAPIAVLVPAQEVKPGNPKLPAFGEPVSGPETEADVPARDEPEQTDPASNEATVANHWQPVERASEVVVVDAVVEPEAAAAEAEAGPAAVGELGYVPRSEDRVLPPPRPKVFPQRIEPTFEAAPQGDIVQRDMPSLHGAAEKTAVSMAADPLIAEPNPPVEKPAVLSGPWTVRRVARLAGLAVAAYFGVVLILILLYRFVNPPTTTLIAYQWLTGTKIEQEWVPIEDISSNLLRAVVVSEDWGFCDHYGVDLDAIERALEQAGEGKVARGASTISMQVIKNLFLSQSKSYLRKAVEIPLTFVAEAVWPKARMLEIYLNIAEWGPGVFGAEAAAQHHFSKPASQLSQREAALLAAALPNPILRDAGDPGTRTARKASVIQSRMRAAGPVADCAMTGRQRASEARPETGDHGPAGWQTTVKKRAGGT